MDANKNSSPLAFIRVLLAFIRGSLPTRPPKLIELMHMLNLWPRLVYQVKRRETFEMGHMQKLKGDGAVVVVDDDPDALNLARIVFKLSTVTRPIVLLESGSDLLEYLNEVSEEKVPMPSIVLLDINMPSPNGHETLQTIRAQKTFLGLPPIVMLTASNNPADEKKAFEAGANGYQVKPLQLKDFVNFANSLVS